MNPPNYVKGIEDFSIDYQRGNTMCLTMRRKHGIPMRWVNLSDKMLRWIGVAGAFIITLSLALYHQYIGSQVIGRSQLPECISKLTTMGISRMNHMEILYKQMERNQSKI